MELIEAFVVILPFVLLVSPDVPIIYAGISTAIAGSMVVGLIVREIAIVFRKDARERSRRRSRIRRARKREKERVAASRIAKKAA